MTPAKYPNSGRHWFEPNRILLCSCECLPGGPWCGWRAWPAGYCSSPPPPGSHSASSGYQQCCSSPDICYYPTDTCSSHYNPSCVISWKRLKRGTDTEFSYRDEQDARYPSVFFFLNPAGHRKRHRETVPTGYRISEKPYIRPNTKQACGKNIFIWKNAISQWFLWRTRKDDYREKLKTSLFYIFWNFFWRSE